MLISLFGINYVFDMHEDVSQEHPYAMPSRIIPPELSCKFRKSSKISLLYHIEGSSGTNYVHEHENECQFGPKCNTIFKFWKQKMKEKKIQQNYSKI